MTHEPVGPVTRRLGVISGSAVAALSLCYVCVLAVGLATLPTPDAPVQQPWFSMMEVLILAIAPAMVALAAALLVRAPVDRKPLALLSVAFLAMTTVVTCAVHFSILTLSRRVEFADAAWQRTVFAFEWPSLAYALDILAWDIFFPLGALAAAATLPGDGLERAARYLLVASGALAVGGLVGVPLANMQVRNVGIIGYAVLFPLAATIVAVIFFRAAPRPAVGGRPN